jgi:sarcosine oxidase
MRKYHTIVLGLGAMGSAAVYQLAKRGTKVLGIDQYDPPHRYGSSHGETRITRLAIGEGVHLTPWALRSHDIWREIERETGARLMTTTGGLVISSNKARSKTHVGRFFANTVEAAKRYGIPHRQLTGREIRRRFPRFNVHVDEKGYYEPAAGILHPEACVRAQLLLARHHGADILTGTRVAGFEASDKGVSVTTSAGRHASDNLVIAAGPWLPELLPQWRGHFVVRRQVLLWFRVKDGTAEFLPGRFPVFIWELKGRTQGLYGFPALDGAVGGVKIATEQYATTTTPAKVDRTVGIAEATSIYETYCRPHIGGLTGHCVKRSVCLYTVTPGARFIIDWLPGQRSVVVISACSGHGFKHSAAIGEAVAQLVLDGQSRLDLTPFKMPEP